MSDIDFLRKIYIFNTLNEEEAKRILAITREVEFLDGETIMEEGAPGSTMYIITKGAVEISKTLTMALGKGEHEEREKVLTTLKAEDHVVFGEMALIGEEVRSASIFAKGYCKLLEIAKDDFWNLMNSRSDMGLKILRRIAELVCKRLKEASNDIIRLTTALSIALSK